MTNSKLSLQVMEQKAVTERVTACHGTCSHWISLSGIAIHRKSQETCWHNTRVSP